MEVCPTKENSDYYWYLSQRLDKVIQLIFGYWAISTKIARLQCGLWDDWVSWLGPQSRVWLGPKCGIGCLDQLTWCLSQCAGAAGVAIALAAVLSWAQDMHEHILTKAKVMTFRLQTGKLIGRWIGSMQVAGSHVLMMHIKNACMMK